MIIQAYPLLQELENIIFLESRNNGIENVCFGDDVWLSDGVDFHVGLAHFKVKHNLG